MNLAVPVSALTPEDLVRLFYQFPCSHVPVVRGDEIQTFLSKALIQRNASSRQFFQSELVEILPRILEDLDPARFFEELDASSDLPDSIPVVQAMELAVETMALSAFNARFRPLQDLLDADMKDVLDALALPVLAFNAKRQCVFRNQRCVQLRRALMASMGGRHAKPEDFLPDAFFKTLEDPQSDRPYQLAKPDGQVIVKWKASRLELSRGSVGIAVFLSAEGDRL